MYGCQFAKFLHISGFGLHRISRSPLSPIVLYSVAHKVVVVTLHCSISVSLCFVLGFFSSQRKRQHFQVFISSRLPKFTQLYTSLMNWIGLFVFLLLPSLSVSRKPNCCWKRTTSWSRRCLTTGAARGKPASVAPSSPLSSRKRGMALAPATLMWPSVDGRRRCRLERWESVVWKTGQATRQMGEAVLLHINYGFCVM